MIKSNRALLCYSSATIRTGPFQVAELTIYFLEHPQHFLDVIQIQEESLWILLILLKWYSESIYQLGVMRRKELTN
jgi:hypothetical protein